MTAGPVAPDGADRRHSKQASPRRRLMKVSPAGTARALRGLLPASSRERDWEETETGALTHLVLPTSVLGDKLVMGRDDRAALQFLGLLQSWRWADAVAAAASKRRRTALLARGPLVSRSRWR
ncbi:hypothetical protein NDU88_002251 [Pleurodeles waltl]|uniref:Uncharacterized protein n=1 Tax=Pleurodeles waltl TaxID=8319 RepID=A0AAV7Q8S8_PLEWA|nr:hypothetical protein NDU88_002251 [Pleurodeles waltl]